MLVMIRYNGRWTSVRGPLPYTIETLGNYQQMAKSLVTSYAKSTLKGAVSAGGQFASSSLLLRSEQVVLGSKLIMCYSRMK